MKRATILIVEDEAIVAADLASKLRQLGHEVVGTTGEGEEAVAMACRLRPQVVLMDIWLKGPMDGVEAAAVIRQRHNVPIIYLTAHSDAATLARAKLTEPFGYVLKPFDERELATHIEMALYKHQAEQELRRQREWLQVTLTSIGDAVLATDDAGRVTFLNPVAAKLTGWAPEEAAGQPVERVFRIINEKTRQPAENVVHRVLRERAVVALANHTALVARDGREIPIEDSAAPIQDDAGEVLGVVLVFHDVTEKRRAREALERARDELEMQVQQRTAALRQTMDSLQMERQRFQEVLDCLPAYLVLISPDYHVPFENRFFRERFGGANGRRCFEYLYDRTEPCENCETYQVFQTGEPHQWEWLGPDGRTYDIHDFPFADPDGTKLVMEVGLDITERRHAEASLEKYREHLEEEVRKRTAQLEAANAAKSRFLANMSHELRTPMNAILGMIDVALPKAADPTVRDCLETAKGSADLLLTLLNDLLDSARIESGKFELEAAPLSIRGMLERVTRVLSVRASEKGLLLYGRIPDEIPDAVTGDRIRLQQVLLNLAGNAIKFTERGEVEISVRGQVHGDAAELEFAVRDTGVGIDPDSLDGLFEPFAQADPSMARRYGGTGLGLSICKSLVKMMGGRIWVESELGKGSTFRFSIHLPLANEPPADFEAPTAIPAVACSPLRILLVEDNPANQKLATYILHDRGHQVEIAADGLAAIDAAGRNPYDVILMDVQMPGMDGLEATAAIREREGGRSRVPIIAMTAHAMMGDRDRCVAAGMDGYLAKPVNAREMIGLVERVARGPDAGTLPDPATAPPAEATPPSEAVLFDPAEALARCFDRPHIVRKMTESFLNDVVEVFPQMRTALEQGNLTEVGRLGHRLKGSLVYLAAQPAVEAATLVEMFTYSPDATPAQADKAIDRLEYECTRLRDALTAFHADAL